MASLEIGTVSGEYRKSPNIRLAMVADTYTDKLIIAILNGATVFRFLYWSAHTAATTPAKTTDGPLPYSDNEMKTNVSDSDIVPQPFHIRMPTPPTPSTTTT